MEWNIQYIRMYLHIGCYLFSFLFRILTLLPFKMASTHDSRGRQFMAEVRASLIRLRSLVNIHSQCLIFSLQNYDPVTLDKWDGNAVKNALNDAIKNVIIFYNSYARPKFILCNKRRPYFFIVYDVLGRKVGLKFSISCQDHVVIYIQITFVFSVQSFCQHTT